MKAMSILCLAAVVMLVLVSPALAYVQKNVGADGKTVEVAGPDVAKQTRVAGMRRGVLEVEVGSSVLMQELAHFHKRRLLEEALDRAAPDPKVLLELGKIYYDASEFGPAAKVLEQGRKLEPHDTEFLEQLARVYAQTGDKKQQIAVLKDLVPTDADDFDRRKRLTRLLLEAGTPIEAEKYARQALEIDLRDGEVREMLLKALAEQKKDAEVTKFRELFEK